MSSINCPPAKTLNRLKKLQGPDTGYNFWAADEPSFTKVNTTRKVDGSNQESPVSCNRITFTPFGL